MSFSNFKGLSNSHLKEVNGGVPTGGGAWTVAADEDLFPTGLWSGSKGHLGASNENYGDDRDQDL